MKKQKLLFIYICILIGILGMEAGGLQYNLLLISEELGLTSTQMGNIVSVQYLAFILIPLMFGGFGDKYGKKIILVLFGFCFSCGCLAVILSSGFLMVLAGVFLIGAGYSICESTGTSVLADVYKEDASRYINWSQSCFSIGALVSPLISQFLCDEMGLNWRIFFGVLMLLYVLLAFWALGMKFPKSGEGASEEHLENGAVKEHLTGKVRLRTICLALGIMIYAGMETGIAFFMGSHVFGVLGTDTYNSLILSMFWLMMIPSRYLVGLVKKNPRKMLSLAYLGATICIAIVILLTTKNGLLAVYAIMGFFFAPIWPLIMGEAGRIDPKNSARISGVMVAFCGIGGVFSPTIFGLLADYVNISASLLFVMIITLAGFLISILYNKVSKC